MAKSLTSCLSAAIIFILCFCAQTILLFSNAENHDIGDNRNHFRFGWKSKNEDKGHLHPLDPLTELEINTTSSIIRNYKRGIWSFIFISLKEPEKSLLLPYFLKNSNPPSFRIPRKSFTLLLNRHRNQAYEVVVNLDSRRVESWTAAPPEANINIGLLLEENWEAERILRQDEEVIERSRVLGWTNMSLITGNTWTLTYLGDKKEFQGKRLVQVFLNGKNFEDDNQYAHPFDFVPIIDLNERRVVAIEDLPTHDDFDGSNKKGNIVPRASANYAPDLRDPKSFRKDFKHVRVTQPEGTSFKITGNVVEWQKFKMRIGYNGREGLIIYNLNYNDNGNVRPLFYRMSLGEVITAYGDPRPPYPMKISYDEGKFSLGYRTNQLLPQVDCIGQVEFFDFIVHDENGQARRIQRAVCVYEEDAGILWKHTDYRVNGKSASVRSQRLGITFTSTIGNYDYIFTWYFYQDGTVEFATRLTGVLNMHLLAVNATPMGHGSNVAPSINAQYHQHYFSLRLDAEIDGNKNSVVLQDVVPLEAPTGSPENPLGQGITTRNTLLKTAGEARTNISPETSRTWYIRNPTSLNPVTKQPVAWRVLPVASAPLLLRRDSPLHPQLAFFDYSTWVTPYQENQLYSGGFYLNNSGLAEWVGRDENANIDNTDIVLWHNFAVTHIPRCEDYPLMPSENTGVILRPVNFFKENPALDVPPRTAVFRDEL